MNSAGIFEQSMGARNRVEKGLSCRPAMLRRLAESTPWNRLHKSLKIPPQDRDATTPVRWGGCPGSRDTRGEPSTGHLPHHSHPAGHGAGHPTQVHRPSGGICPPSFLCCGPSNVYCWIANGLWCNVSGMIAQIHRPSGVICPPSYLCCRVQITFYTVTKAFRYSRPQ